jgi:hypothetical protein
MQAPSQTVNLSQLAYVLLLPVFFLLHNYNDLFGFISITLLLTFGLCMYIFAGIVFLISFLISRSMHVASFITFCALVFALFFGAWHDLIKSITAQSVLSRHLFFLPATILFFIALIWFFIKKQQALKKFTGYISLVVLILCCMEFVRLFLQWQQYQKDNNLIYPTRPICDNYVSCNLPDTSKPDIYFIVFDEYTDNRHLEKLWHYDNKGITRWLMDKGFYIPDSSKANYSFTPYSISSMLNMNYFDVSKGGIDDRIYKCLKGVRSISDNETICLLQQEGYDIQFFCPFNTAFNNLDVDHEFDHYAQKQLFNQTFPGRLIQDFGWKYQPSPAIAYKKHDDDNRLMIDSIKSTTNASVNRRPQFIYGHLMITHKPHIYNAAGKVRTAADIAGDPSLFNSYINQVKKANTVIQELVTHIQTHNKRNTLILVMGDHGYRYLPLEQRAYYFPNFSAFYFPGKNPSPALRNISAVNTFRIVFNQYFCQNLPLLKDSSILVKY